MKNARTYYDLKGCKARISVHQGGTRSGKTYSILMLLAELCYRNPGSGLVISMVRKTFPALRATVLRDFVEILTGAGWYSEADHNKSEGTYKLFGNLVEYFSLDQPAKLRGRKRDLLYICEANEISKEAFRQLLFRTKHKAILCFNPSEPFHWIYTDVLTREDCNFFRTTYRDNPHLDPSLVQEIEMLKDSDPEYWRVYGEGERATNRRAIYQGAQEPRPEGAKRLGIGCDFGFTNDPTAVVEVFLAGNQLHIEERLYKHGLTNQDLARELLAMNLGREYVICDSAEPKSIEELRREGINAHPATKGPDSVRRGIDLIRRHRLTFEGENLAKELQMYRWKEDKNGNLINEPDSIGWDHALDAARYVALNRIQPKYTGKYVIA